MNEESLNQDIRTFLKDVGVNSHREILEAIRQALDSGQLQNGTSLSASMTLSIEAIGLTRTFTGELSVS